MTNTPPPPPSPETPPEPAPEEIAVRAEEEGVAAEPAPTEPEPEIELAESIEAPPAAYEPQPEEFSAYVDEEPAGVEPGEPAYEPAPEPTLPEPSPQPPPEPVYEPPPPPEPAPPPPPPPPVMQEPPPAAPPPASAGFNRRTILIAVGAVIAVLIVIAITLYTNRRPGEPLLPTDTPTTAQVQEEEWPGLSEQDRLHVRPERIGRPTMGIAMQNTILSGYADMEFTVGADGRASDIRTARESVEDIGYAAEAARLIRAAQWPTQWRGRTAPYPARYRVIFPPGRRGGEIAPLSIASPNITPEIAALGQNVAVTLFVRVSPDGAVESARVISGDPESAAASAEALRVALGARFPPSPQAGYDTQLTVRFDVVGARPAEQAPTGPTVSLSEVPFTQRPSSSDFSRHYPRRALYARQEGRVTLQCVVQRNLRLQCAIASEDPPGAGFGQAAVRISNRFRAARQFEDGRSTIGAQVSVPMVFRAE